MIANNRMAVVGVDLGCTGDDTLMEGLRLLATSTLSKLHLLFVFDPIVVMKERHHQLESEDRALASAPHRVVSKTVLPDLPYAPGEATEHAVVSSGHGQASTEIDAWRPSDNGPTGLRIV